MGKLYTVKKNAAGTYDVMRKGNLFHGNIGKREASEMARDYNRIEERKRREWGLI